MSFKLANIVDPEVVKVSLETEFTCLSQDKAILPLVPDHAVGHTFHQKKRMTQKTLTLLYLVYYNLQNTNP